MKQVILSADYDKVVYLVPDIVADHLREYCMEFCNEWLWKAKEASKYRQMVGDEVGVCYNEEDFIEYLNTYIFPDQPSTFVKNLGFDIPKQYQHLPYFNF